MKLQLIASGSRPWEKMVKYWGLSFLIDDSILFDTFANPHTLFRKLKRAHVDLAQIKTVVISHDHWDHVGGLRHFLEERPGIDLYAPPQSGESLKNRTHGVKCRLIDSAGMKEIKPNIFVMNEMLGEHKGKRVIEQAIAIKSDRGLILLVGCSHPGILEIVKNAKQTFDAPVYGIIGGFHLLNMNADDVRTCAEKLVSEGVSIIAPTHCTGWRAEHIFKTTFRERYISLREGQILDL